MSGTKTETRNSGEGNVERIHARYTRVAFIVSYRVSGITLEAVTVYGHHASFVIG